MGTRRIVEQITSQATQVGCLTGAALGAAYGVLLPLGFALASFFQTGNLGNGEIVLMTFGCLIGIFIGGIVGGVAGLILGLSNGLAIGWLTIACYTPMHHPQQYRWSVRLTSVLVTLLCILLASLALGRVPSEDFERYFVGLPLLLTLPCGWLAGWRLANWYLTQLDQAGQHNRPALLQFFR